MLVTLQEWAKLNFAGQQPSVITMRRWAVAGKFSPRAMKIGRAYYVESNAQFVGGTRNDIGHKRNKRNGEQAPNNT